MKKKVQILLTACLAVLTLLFAFLYLCEKNNKDDLRLLAQSGAADAYTQFAAYQKDRHESDYWKGVAAFRSFEQAYYLLTENTNKTTNYTFCNEVYGALVIYPEKCQNRVGDLVAVLRILAQNVEDENGYLKMLELRNLLEHD